jgi:replicative DNA helicase
VMIEQFSESFLRGVLQLMTRDESFAVGAFKWLEPGFFPGQMSWVFTQFVESVSQGRPPDPLIIAEHIGSLPEHLRSPTHRELRAISASHVADADGMKELLREFSKRAKFAQAFQTGRDMYLANQSEDAYQFMFEKMEEIRSISFNTVERHWLAEGFEERQRKRRITQVMGFECTPTGIEPLDALTGGGIRPSEAWIMMAYSKVGKSMWLRHCGAVGLRMRRRVLHIQLEGTADETLAFYDAWFGRQIVSDVKMGVFDPDNLEIIRATYRQLKGLCVVRTLNSWNVTAADIEAEVKDLNAGGFAPDLCIIDYLDLLRAMDGGKDETQTQTMTSKEVKKLATRHGFGVHTATQLSRPKEGWERRAHIARANKIADAYAKVRPMDLIGSINITEDESEANLARLYIEMYRHGPAHKTIPLRTDLGQSKYFYDPALTISSETNEIRDPNAVGVVPDVLETQWWDD